MAVSKVIYGSQTLIDLTADTVTADTLAQGVTAHDKSGTAITGTMQAGSGGGSSGPDSVTLVWEPKNVVTINGTNYTDYSKIWLGDGLNVYSPYWFEWHAYDSSGTELPYNGIVTAKISGTTVGTVELKQGLSLINVADFFKPETDTGSSSYAGGGYTIAFSMTVAGLETSFSKEIDVQTSERYSGGDIGDPGVPDVPF